MEVNSQLDQKDKSNLWVVLAILFILAFSLLRFTTWNWGVAVSDDSIFYISAAENFLKGEGISRIGGGNVIKPLTHFPPLYPIVLSFLGYFVGVQETANWWGAILFGINIVLISLMIYQGTKSKLVSLLAGLLAITSPFLLSIHSEAMSEPLYISSTLSCFLLLVGYLRNGKTWQLILAAIAASFAYLTRYIGISVVLTGLLSLFFLVPDQIRTRLKKVVVFGLIAIVPNLLWYIRNYLLTGSFTNRVFSFHPISQEKLKEGLLSVSEWILPPITPMGLGLGLVLLVLLLCIAAILIEFKGKKVENQSAESVRRNRVSFLIALHIGVYGLLLFLSLTFFDISTRLNNRILIPLYLMLFILSFISIQWILSSYWFSFRKVVYLVSTVLFLFALFSYISMSWDLVKGLRETGSGYSSSTWRSSELVAILKRLDSNWIIYSNEAFPVYYLTGIGAYGIPEKFDPVKLEERADFQSSMKVMRERLQNPNSAMVVFHQGYLREGMPTLEEIMEGLVIAHESRDGLILVAPDNLQYWDIQ